MIPAPQTEMQEVAAERYPHFGIPGFEKLPHEAQDRYLKIPAEMLDKARPLIEVKITEYSEVHQEEIFAQTAKAEGKTEEMTATNRETQANTAIETFHRAEAGDPKAKKDLLDAKNELFGEEPTDDDIFQTMLEDQGGMFDNSLVLEVALSDADTQQHQDVLDLFKEFRGDMASVDEVIKPAQQIDLFIELTKGGGTLTERMFFVRKVLTVLTSNGTRNLSEGLKAEGVYTGDGILQSGVSRLRTMASSSEVKAEFA